MTQRTTETNQAFSQRVILPLSGLVVILLAFAVGGIFWIASYQTSVAISQQVRLANGALRIHADKLAVSAADYGYWDEAVESVVNAPDYEWMKDNLGSGLSRTLGLDMSYIIDANGRTVFSFADGTNATKDKVVPMPEAFRQSYDNWKSRPAGERYSAVLPFAGTAVAIAIAPLRSSSQPDKAPTGYALIFGHLVDKDLLAELAQNFELANIRQVATSADITDSRALIAIGGTPEIGAASTRFTWDPQKPGNDLLKIALPFSAIFLMVLSLLGAMLSRYLDASAEIITDREARANHDALTGLANRARFFAELEQRIGEILPGLSGIAVMYIDLDGFKAVNDTLGHSAGDELLIQAAGRFQSCLRSYDLVARLGGDEFAIIMSGNVEKPLVQAIGTRILLALGEPFELKAGTAHVGCSIGIADGWRRDISGADLLNRADKALYQVKASGKNALRFADDYPAKDNSGDDLIAA